MNKRSKKIWLLYILFVLLFTITSCSVLKTTEVKNNVTNEITNKVVSVDEIKITDLEDALEVAYQKVTDACVGVVRRYLTNVSGIDVEQSEATGSGVIYKRVENYNDDGILENYTYYLITNRHVILGSNSTRTYKNYVYIQKENRYIELELISYDEKVDIACLKFNHTTYIDPVKFGDSDELKCGNFVFAVGCPKGFDYYNSMTFGIVSSPLRYLSDDTDNDGVNDFVFEYIQLDCAINPGNSGGGLFNLKGELVGINTMKIASVDVDSMGFSIPINVISNLLTNFLEQNKKIVRPRLGVSGYEMCELTDYTILSNNLKEIPNIYQGIVPYGIYVLSLVDGGSLSSSGIKKDDILLEIDDIKIVNNNIVPSMFNSLIKYHIGDEVSIKYYSRTTESIVVEKIILKDK